MDTLKNLYQDTGFIIAFMVMIIVIEITLGNKITNKFLYLVLFSMIVLNSDKFTSFMKEAFKI
jgi:hypothetical protein